MKKILSVFTIIFLILSSVAAQIPMKERMELQAMLAERAKNFSAYTNSIQKKSGIFGNKTKADIQKSNEVLLAIVTLDNDIMDALNRALSYKSFEKTTDNYSSRDCEMKLEQSMHVTDTLTKQLALADKKLRKRDNSTVLYKALFYMALAGCLVLFIMLKRKNKPTAQY